MMRKGWQEKELGEFMEFKNGVNAAKEAYGHGVKFVNLMDIFKKPFLEKDDISGSVAISPKQASEYSVQEGDILFNRTSETPEEIACSAVYMGKEKITFGGFVIRGRQTKNLLIPSFAGYCFQNDQVRKSLISKCQGVVRGNIGQKELSKVSILIPPVDEQKKIAAILRTWDDAIDKTGQTISIKQKQFECLQNKYMKKLEDELPKVELGNFTNFSQTKRLSSTSGEKLLTVKLHCQGIEASARETANVTDKGRPYYKRSAGEFIIGRQNFHNGGFGIVPSHLNGYIASNAITSLDVNSKKLDIDFLYYFMSRRNYYLRIGHIMDGTGQKELSDKQITKLPLVVPSLETQRAVARILKTAQQEIDILKRQRDALIGQKRGLMQKLLTGAWPVQASDKEAA